MSNFLSKAFFKLKKNSFHNYFVYLVEEFDERVVWLGNTVHIELGVDYLHQTTKPFTTYIKYARIKIRILRIFLTEILFGYKMYYQVQPDGRF